jgi:hypothetical protein
MKIHAFALIELSVIIAVTALLLSTTMLVLQRAKQHALRIVCKNNLHSCGIAGNLYLAENRCGLAVNKVF